MSWTGGQYYCVYPSPHGKEGILEVENGHTSVIYPKPGKFIECRPSPYRCCYGDLAITDEGLIMMASVESHKLLFQLYSPTKNGWESLYRCKDFTGVRKALLCSVGKNTLACTVFSDAGDRIIFVNPGKHKPVSHTEPYPIYGLPDRGKKLHMLHRNGNARETIYYYDGTTILECHKKEPVKRIAFSARGKFHTAIMSPNGSALLLACCNNTIRGYDFDRSQEFTFFVNDNHNIPFFYGNTVIWCAWIPDDDQDRYQGIMEVWKREKWYDALEKPVTPSSKYVALVTAWTLEHAGLPRELIDIVQRSCRYAIC